LPFTAPFKLPIKNGRNIEIKLWEVACDERRIQKWKMFYLFRIVAGQSAIYAGLVESYGTMRFGVVLDAI